MTKKIKKLDLNIMNTQKKCEKADISAVDLMEEVIFFIIVEYILILLVF